jgi:hypothetical protein
MSVLNPVHIFVLVLLEIDRSAEEIGYGFA